MMPDILKKNVVKQRKKSALFTSAVLQNRNTLFVVNDTELYSILPNNRPGSITFFFMKIHQGRALFGQGRLLFLHTYLTRVDYLRRFTNVFLILLVDRSSGMPCQKGKVNFSGRVDYLKFREIQVGSIICTGSQLCFQAILPQGRLLVQGPLFGRIEQASSAKCMLLIMKIQADSQLWGKSSGI